MICNCKPGVCWFKISIFLSLLATLTCLGGDLYFGGPPPTEQIDIGLKHVYVTSIVSIFVSFACILTLVSQTKSSCIFICCNLGLVFVFFGSFSARYTLHEVKFDAETITAYMQSYFRINGESPPFLRTLEEHRQCCGIQGIQDYIQVIQSNPIETNNSISYRIPNVCCSPEIEARTGASASKFIHCGENIKSLNFLPSPVSLRVDAKITTTSTTTTEEGKDNMVLTGSIFSSIFASLKDKLQLQIETEVIDTEKSVLSQQPQPSVRGCWEYLESLTNFLSGFPVHVQEWVFWTIQAKDTYLRFMVVYNFILFFVYNYHFLRYRLRRPALAVVPRALPQQVEFDSRRGGSVPQSPTLSLRPIHPDHNNNNIINNAQQPVISPMTNNMNPNSYPYPAQTGPHPYLSTTSALSAVDPRLGLGVGLQFYHARGGEIYTCADTGNLNTINPGLGPGQANERNTTGSFPIANSNVLPPGIGLEISLAPPPPAYTPFQISAQQHQQAPVQPQGPCNKCIGLVGVEVGNEIGAHLTHHHNYLNPNQIPQAQAITASQVQGQGQGQSQNQGCYHQPIQNFEPSAPPPPPYESL